MGYQYTSGPYDDLDQLEIECLADGLHARVLTLTANPATINESNDYRLDVYRNADDHDKQLDCLTDLRNLVAHIESIRAEHVVTKA
jgi:hypothetical protein